MVAAASALCRGLLRTRYVARKLIGSTLAPVSAASVHARSIASMPTSSDGRTSVSSRYERAGPGSEVGSELARRTIVWERSATSEEERRESRRRGEREEDDAKSETGISAREINEQIAYQKIAARGEKLGLSQPCHAISRRTRRTRPWHPRGTILCTSQHLY